MAKARYKIFYDGRCWICRRGRSMILRMRPMEAVEFVDIHDDAAMAGFPQISNAQARGEMHVLDDAGRLTGGYDSLAALAYILPATRYIAPLLGVAPIRAVGRWLYKWLAANRYRLGGQVSCQDGACSIDAGLSHRART